MNPARTPLFVANWKMNLAVKDTAAFASAITAAVRDIPGALGETYDLGICPPATHLATLARLLEGSRIAWGGQNSGTAKSGAFTGEISPVVLRELGARYVILGHSERRHVFKEEDPLIFSRLLAALEAGLTPILCIGEVLQERRSGKTFNRVESQLALLKDAHFPKDAWGKLVIAYEPVWAIGTGENATPAQAQEVHVFIRQWIAEKASSEVASRLKILYGGSVKPENAQALMRERDVDGFLIGGASLDALSFAGVVRNGLKSGT